MSVYTVILAGGSGTRFWPLSRAARPKQFLPLASGSPLLVDTIRRVSSGLKRTYVSCGSTHAPMVRKLVKGLPPANLLVEPMARNTAAAIGLAAIHVAKRDASAVLQVLPADHAVRDARRFRAVLAQAAEIARRGALVTLGIRPSRAETGYGYIQLGESLEAGAFRVRAFVEKPDAATAQRFVESGDYLWNAGIFIFRADAILDALQKFLPELWQALNKIAPAIGKPTYATVARRAFLRLPSVSIDYAVMEKADNLAVVPGDFGWSDLGSFSSLPDVRPVDEHGNVVIGRVSALVDCRDCVIFAGRRPLALAGLSGVVVVDAGDVILVVPKQHSQQVREIVEEFKVRRLNRYL
jgi:mannose-1-phosphate guanylyltransferase